MSYERLTGSRIAAWLNNNYVYDRDGQTFKFTAFPPITPGAPANLGVVTLLPGAGLLDEKQFESRGFSLTVRSIQNMPEIAETVAIEVDNLLHTMDMPWKCNGALVREITWMGGGPAPLPVNALSYRYSWTCNYKTISVTGF